MLLLTRKYTFSAAHRLWNPGFTEVENATHFGPCINLHGHNYTLEVTVGGIPDARTGMLMNITALDEIVQVVILAEVDHKYLDQDVAFLAGTLSTVENVVQVFYQRLVPHIPAPVVLHRVRLYESENNWAEVIHKEMYSHG